jgi:hypothetical protein
MGCQAARAAPWGAAMVNGRPIEWRTDAVLDFAQ